MNDVLKCIDSRRSIREFTDEKIDENELAVLLKAALHAPSGRNDQPLFFVILKDDRKLSDFKDFLKTGNFYNAQAILFIFERKEDHLNDLNCGAAIENVLLAAESLGLGACWIHSARNRLNEEDSKAFMKDLLKFDKEYVALDAVALGHIKGLKPAMKPRNMANDKII